MNNQTLTDEQLVVGLCESKIAAFDAIYARYWKTLYGVSYSQLGTKEEAEDIVHNVCELIWNNREIQKINCLKAYLIVSVQHFSINYIKSQITYRKFQKYLIFQEIQKSFSSVETGLTTKNSEELHGFSIAGADKKFFWAVAQIEGNSVIISSDKVPHPEAVRYSWESNPNGNLYNKEGLPTVPFRTDNFKMITDK